MQAWIYESLLEPLHMTDSSYEWREAFINNFAQGHDKNGTPKKSGRFYNQGNAAYSLYTTPTDYALFLMEIMKSDRSAGYSLSPESVRKPTTLQVRPEEGNERSYRSLGWVVVPEENGGWICHSGSNGTGFRCNARFHIKRKSGCVIMTNSDSGRTVWEAIVGIIDSMPSQSNSISAIPEVVNSDSVQRTVRYEYRVMNPTPKDTGNIDVYVPLPSESPHQKIHYLHLPDNAGGRIFTDIHGQKLVHYSFDRLVSGQWVDLGFVVGVTLYNTCWNPPQQAAYQNTTDLTSEQRKRYLMAETNYSMDAELMRKVAADLTQDTEGDFEKLEKIHDYVIRKIRYVRDNTWDPAAVVLARGAGSCSEYNYVLSGLCRLAGLPTRCVGGTTNGFRDLPTTDTVFHRWTEVFLSGYGWFPVDCSRDANPIRGKRSHFGRVYADALVWCRQAGGEKDFLGWEYRAKVHIKGENPGIRENHHARWFAYHPREQVEEAYNWFLGNTRTLPEPDLLECALVHWQKATVEDQVKIIHALAAAGRNICFLHAAGLPEADKRRDRCVRELCDSQELSDIILKESLPLYPFFSWYKNNESCLVPTPDGRFKLKKRTEEKKVQFTAASSSEIWASLAAELVNQLAASLDTSMIKTAVVMPVEDQTMAGLGQNNASIHSALKNLLSGRMKVQLIEEDDFDRLMEEQGPGSKEYWILANGERGDMPASMAPDMILVPLCITERSEKEKGVVLYHLECKALHLSTRKYTRFVARKYRRKEDIRTGQNALNNRHTAF
ncbi:MAG: serine hydrolase [Sedimentisphaerales bacterium]|nr:serine hydrolase [Sedimentisphaerales bacterium]